MAKSISVSKTTQEGTSSDILVKEGRALYSIWKQTNSLKDSTNPKGFDTRLGKLLQQLKAMSPLDSGQISRQTLHQHNVDKIDRRRRSEALWFVENEVECKEFIKASKKGFTSLTALQAAMRKSAKADDTAPTTAKAEPVKSEPTKVEPSNVGQSTPVSKQVVFDKLVKVCNANGIDMLELAEMIIDHSTAPTSTQVAA